VTTDAERRPKLRPLQAIPYASQGEQLVCLRDPTALTNKTAVLPARAFFIAALCDGAHTVRDIQAEYLQRFGDLVLIETIESLVKQLDDALLLEGENLETHRRAQIEAFARAPKRAATFAGQAYPAQPAKLRQWLNALFESDGAPGPLTPAAAKKNSIAAAIAPHISPDLAAPCYAHAWKEIAENCGAETLVVLGVAHSPSNGVYVLTDKDFATPLGDVPCDKEFVRDLRKRSGVFGTDDEILHRHEHSVEFQALFMRYAFGASRPVRIVPVLCGPLPDEGPEAGAVRDFTGALREILDEQDGRAAVIASVDLSHVGRKFGDPSDLNPGLLAWIEAEDRALLKHAESLDAASFFEHNRRDGDRRHVCGFSAIYTLLASVPAVRGRLLHYGQAPEPQTQSVVTFAAMAFDRE
jgi:hypothetical protein